MMNTPLESNCFIRTRNRSVAKVPIAFADRRSKSNWDFPIKVVHKTDFIICITVDYKPLNKVIKIDCYPILSVADLYAKLGLSEFFSKIDLKAAYNQKMTERFYRPFFGQEIKKYVKSCYTCQKVKLSENPNWAELRIILPQRTNEMVVTDMAGPFKTTVRGDGYLQIIAGAFSKFFVCRPTKNKGSMIANL